MAFEQVRLCAIVHREALHQIEDHSRENDHPRMRNHSIVVDRPASVERPNEPHSLSTPSSSNFLVRGRETTRTSRLTAFAALSTETLLVEFDF
jgi:hypothetical protein